MNEWMAVGLLLVVVDEVNIPDEKVDRKGINSCNGGRWQRTWLDGLRRRAMYTFLVLLADKLGEEIEEGLRR